MKIAYVEHHPTQYRSPLLRLLAKEVDLTVFYSTLAGAETYRDPEFGAVLKWDVPLLEGYRWEVVWPARLLWRLREFDAVLVHGYNRPLQWGAILGAHVWGKRLLYRGETTAHNDLFHRWLFAHFDAVLAIGTVSRNAALALGVPEGRIFWCPYAVDNEWFALTSAHVKDLDCRGAVRDLFGWPHEVPIVLFTGKLIPRKRPLDILAACEGLACATLFVGDGPERPSLENAIAKSRVRAAITGFVNQTEIPAFYAAADVLILPSEHEPWGLALNEAMACGLPVIASNGVAAAADLVCTYPMQNGFVYRVGDIERLKAQLWVLLESNLRETMGAHSREIIKGFSFEADIKGILEALR